MKADKRVHGMEAAGAGDLGAVAQGRLLGPCPSCGAELRVTRHLNPSTGRDEDAILHPSPFCTYYGETDADVIARDVIRLKS